MTYAKLDTPIRKALEALFPSPWDQSAAFLLFNSQPEALAPDVRRALDMAVEDSLAELGAA